MTETTLKHILDDIKSYYEQLVWFDNSGQHFYLIRLHLITRLKIWEQLLQSKFLSDNIIKELYLLFNVSSEEILDVLEEFNISNIVLYDVIAIESVIIANMQLYFEDIEEYEIANNILKLSQIIEKGTKNIETEEENFNI